MVLVYNRQIWLVQSSDVQGILSSGVGIIWPSESSLIDGVVTSKVLEPLRIILYFPLLEFNCITDSGDSEYFLPLQIGEIEDFQYFYISSCLNNKIVEWESLLIWLQWREGKLFHILPSLVDDEVVIAIIKHLNFLEV